MELSNRWFIGAIIILVGIIALLKNAGLIPDDFWRYFWPVLIILIGLRLILTDKKAPPA